MNVESLSIPTVVWSGIVAAAISLAGVILSNWSTARRLRMQLQHDSTEKLKDRLSTLRKEVYLQLYSDVTVLQGHLGALSTKDPTSPEFGAPIQAVIAQLARVQLVGGAEVMEQASELSAAFTESLFHLMVAAKPMHGLRTDIALADQFYNQDMQEAQRINAEMVTENESGHPNPSRVAALQRSLKTFRASYEQHREERDEAWQRYNASQGGFLDVVKAQIHRLAPRQAKLMAALKNEIGVPTEVSDLMARIDATEKRMEAALQNVQSEFVPTDT